MKLLKEENQFISTILSFALIPVSGLAVDIFIPSLPAMAENLKVSHTAVQATLVIFMISYGVSQLFVGSLLDSFGRYRLGLAALFIFSVASFTIGFAHSIEVVYAMRVIQGITTAVIVVSKRAYFVDVYSGEKLKHYISLFSIIWASAPIIAPFIGGYLQTVFGWQANFYFLGLYTLLLLLLESIYGGETLKIFHPFKAKPIIDTYLMTLKTYDYLLAVLLLGLTYAVLVVYGMSSPFIIEQLFHYSPVVTGYCALISGVALMAGGIIAKAVIKRPFTTKILIAVAVQIVAGTIMFVLSAHLTIYTLMIFVILMQLAGGFIFNNFFSFALSRFTRNAGIASGITGGSLYILTSIFSYFSVKFLDIKDIGQLAVAYIIFAAMIGLAFGLFYQVRRSYSVVAGAA